MSQSYLTLTPIAGGHIQNSMEDAVRVATLLAVCVKININGIDVFVMPGDCVATIADNYDKARDRGATFVSANVIPRGKTTHSSGQQSHD